MKNFRIYPKYLRNLICNFERRYIKTIYMMCNTRCIFLFLKHSYDKHRNVVCFAYVLEEYGIYVLLPLGRGCEEMPMCSSLKDASAVGIYSFIGPRNTKESGRQDNDLTLLLYHEIGLLKNYLESLVRCLLEPLTNYRAYILLNGLALTTKSFLCLSQTVFGINAFKVGFPIRVIIDI